MPTNRHTLRTHLAQMLVATVVSIGIAVPAITYAITKIQLESHFRSQALRSSLVAARQGIFSFLGAPPDVAAADAEKLRDLTGAEYVAFMDTERSQTIADSGHPTSSINLPSGLATSGFTGPTVASENGHAWDIVVPVVATSRTDVQSRTIDDQLSTPIGLLYVRYSKDSVTDLVTTVSMISSLISVCVMLVAILWGRRRLRELISPLDALSHVMANADDGQRATSDGPHEVAAIASVYNVLMDRLDRQRDNLEATVAARTADLEKALDAAKQAERFKTGLLSNSTHEMKTPLHLIDAAVRRSLHELEFLPNTAGIRDAQRTVLRASGELLSRIEKILRNARIEGELHQLTLTRIDLLDFITRLSDRFTPLAVSHDNHLRFDSSGTPTVIADESKVFEVTCELVMNSCKFTHGGTISVHLHVGDSIEISVTDSGSGIVLEEQSRIWEEFYQCTPIDDHPPNFPGQGLGLSMVKRLVSQMRGKIQLDSAIGRGTTIVVHLPLAESFPSPAPLCHTAVFESAK